MRKVVAAGALCAVWVPLVWRVGVLNAVLGAVATVVTALAYVLCVLVPAGMPLTPRSLIILGIGWANKYIATMTPPKYTIMSDVMGYQTTQLLGIACELRIPDVLTKDGRATPAQLSPSIDWRDGAQRSEEQRAKLLYRVMRALAAGGVFDAHPDGTFTHTPTSLVLREDHPESQSAYAQAHAQLNYPAWGHLLAHLRGGRNPMVEAQNGKSYYEFLSSDPDGNRLLQRKMEAIGKVTNAGLLRDVDWAGLVGAGAAGGGLSLVDIGGGRGQFLRQLLASGPMVAADVRAVLVDAEDVVGLARQELANDADECAVACRGRLAFSPGNFITGDGLPTGAGTYLIKYVCNDWEDSIVERILRNVRKAGGSGARLLIVEQVAPPTGRGGGPMDRSAISDLDFLVINGGAVRTRAEFAALAAKAGFEVEDVLATSGITKVVVCRAVGDDPAGAAQGPAVASLLQAVSS